MQTTGLPLVCATIRVETRTADGTEIGDADCELSNEFGSVRLHTPGNVTICRSPSDLDVLYSKAEQEPAHGSGVSRANAGMWGNIIFGGGDDKDGPPSVARKPRATACRSPSRATRPATSSDQTG